jgi:signal transduction histidine kinase
MSVVIGSPQNPFGVLSAHSRQRRRFTADDSNFLQAVANVIAASSERSAAEGERRRLEELAAAQARLAEIGALTAKVVHDLGNPLAALSMQAQLLRRRIEQGDPPEKMQAPVERILATVSRLDELAHDLSSFAREQRLQLATFDLRAFLAELVELWTPVAVAHCSELTLADTTPPLLLCGDRAKLQRVFENLIKNAIEAVNTPPGSVVISCTLPDSETVCVCVEDNGRGIDEGFDAFRLFETTKAEGTGLGLAVARQIVLAHEGTIDHHRRFPQGTEFCVTLPLAGPHE